jgi:hypothetical protein
MKNLAKILKKRYPFNLYDKKGNKVYTELTEDYWMIRKFNSINQMMSSIDSEGETIEYYYNSSGVLESTKVIVVEEDEYVMDKEMNELWGLDEEDTPDFIKNCEEVILNVDYLLEKITDYGMESLSEEELKFLGKQK